MNESVAKQYADKLYYNWMVAARRALVDSSWEEEVETRGNLLISTADLPPFDFEMLEEIRGVIAKKLEDVLCSSHNVSRLPMVGYVLDTGGRGQLMMWVAFTPRKSVLRERRA